MLICVYALSIPPPSLWERFLELPEQWELLVKWCDWNNVFCVCNVDQCRPPWYFAINSICTVISSVLVCSSHGNNLGRCSKLKLHAMVSFLCQASKFSQMVQLYAVLECRKHASVLGLCLVVAFSSIECKGFEGSFSEQFPSCAFLKWRWAYKHQFHSLGQDRSTVAQCAEMTKAEHSHTLPGWYKTFSRVIAMRNSQQNAAAPPLLPTKHHHSLAFCVSFYIWNYDTERSTAWSIDYPFSSVEGETKAVCELYQSVMFLLLWFILMGTYEF